MVMHEGENGDVVLRLMAMLCRWKEKKMGDDQEARSTMDGRKTGLREIFGGCGEAWLRSAPDSSMG